MSETKAAAKKTVKPPPLPGPTQLDRVTAAIARLPRFDKLWLEKLQGALAASEGDSSLDREMWVLAETLLKRATDWNMLRAHPKFPKSFVGE